ncbi:MAG: U32 family peptidase [Acidimicrobiales bacterium]
MRERVASALSSIDLPQSRARDAGRALASKRRFADGSAWRVEIPSVEGPEAMKAVMAESAARAVPVHRVSQGSGTALLTEAELGEMAELGRASGSEVVLWAGLRAAWDISAMARSASGATAAAALRGTSALAAGLEEAMRAADAGIDGVLVSDVGLLWALGRAKRAGQLPADFVLKTSLALPTMNPASARVYVELGATSLNLATDLPIPDIASIREAVEVPLDCYIEGADDFAAPLRYHEIEEIVEVAAPVHLKFGLRNVAGVYPSGGHLTATVVSASRERVRRAAIGIETLQRRAPELCGP